MKPSALTEKSLLKLVKGYKRLYLVIDEDGWTRISLVHKELRSDVGFRANSPTEALLKALKAQEVHNG
jgi:hypothetical protein